MSSEIVLDPQVLGEALAEAGRIGGLRDDLFEGLRQAQREASDPEHFREHVRWPLIVALMGRDGTHRVELANGLVFEVGADSRIEKALLLSDTPRPDHIWEPQTTKLLVALAGAATNVVVGGAYIGDHALPMAQQVDERGVVHAFEPMEQSYRRLVRNIAINQLANVQANRAALWDRSGVPLLLDGALALASSLETGAGPEPDSPPVESVTITDYVAEQGLPAVELIMLDTEGGEERALRGAVGLLEQPPGQAPNVVFEIHRSFVDWSDGLERTPIVGLLLDRGYDVFAIRDYHDNVPMAGFPIELVPASKVYLEGPPHGFNMLAVKEPGVLEGLDVEIVTDVSPKLLHGRDPALHQPLTGSRPAPFARR